MIVRSICFLLLLAEQNPTLAFVPTFTRPLTEGRLRPAETAPRQSPWAPSEKLDRLHSSLFSPDGLLVSAVPSVSLDQILRNPVFWSCSVMITIVLLLQIWEGFLEFARENVPKSMKAVIESMLAEMGSLGFIGILIGLALNKIALGDTVAGLSEEYLGESDLLLETFEFLHQAFFQVAVLFFSAASIMIYRVTQKLYQITTIAEQELGRRISDYESDSPEAVERLAQCFEVYTIPTDMADTEDLDQQALWVQKQRPSPAWNELTMSMKERGAEALIIRERLIEELNLGEDFRIANYLETQFADNNVEIVELSPLAWLPLVPILALANSLDLTHSVINADSMNAAESSGYFFSTPWVLLPTLALETICLTWGAFNFWKMAEIKSMLMPSVVRVPRTRGKDGSTSLKLLQPPVECLFLRENFNSSPAFIRPLERLFREEEPETITEELFGEVGGTGPEVYLNSIKFHTWFSVVNLFFFSSQILVRDVYALQANVQVGDTEHLIPELITYGSLVALNAWQLYVAPTTFLNLCLVSSVENLKKEWAQTQGIQGWDGTPFRGREDGPETKASMT